jgi:hypothetical protein
LEKSRSADAEITLVVGNSDQIDKLGVADRQSFALAQLLAAVSASLFASFRSRASLQLAVRQGVNGSA